MISRELSAFNTATQSENKMHDDEVAKKFGFGGGLVPGVELHGYLSWGPASHWGEQWLTSGTISSRYGSPTYDGQTMTVEFDEQTGECRLRNPDGEVTAWGTATLPEKPAAAPDLAAYPVGDLPEQLPKASPETLATGTVLGTVSVDFPDETAQTYLDDVREVLPIYTERGIAHPGWIVRLGNRALTRNVQMGPWIHVGSVVQNLAPITAGSTVTCRGTVSNQWEKSGHRFVELDLLVCADDQPAAHLLHTAIYEPRQVREMLGQI